MLLPVLSGPATRHLFSSNHKLFLNTPKLRTDLLTYILSVLHSNNEMPKLRIPVAGTNNMGSMPNTPNSVAGSPHGSLNPMSPSVFDSSPNPPGGLGAVTTPVPNVSRSYGAMPSTSHTAMQTPASQLCAVCGDTAACQHYGVRTCEGCKGKWPVLYQKTYNIRGVIDK